MTPFAVNTYGHNGGTDACVSNFLFDPETKIGVVILMNQIGDGSICAGLPRVIFGKSIDNHIFETKEVKTDIDISGVYTGTRGYFSGMTKMFSIFSPNPIAKTGDNTYSLAGMVDLKPLSTT